VNSYRAVLFDAGETLVHPHPSFLELFGLILEREGYHVDPDVVLEKIHVVSEHFARAARDGVLWTTSTTASRAFWLAVYRDFLAQLGLPTDDGLGELLYGEFTQISNYRAFPEVASVLERLSAAGLRLGVVSNFEEWLEGLLDVLGIASFFEVRVISGVEGMEKPDHRIFNLALDRLGVSANDSVYVGDNPMFDVEPAEAIGMLGILIDRRGRWPDHVGTRITTLDDLPLVLGVA
jgi:HAD superfamily hydrolase (TIGR01549 family)